MEEHCSQEGTLATICEKLVNIESDIKEIKVSQKLFSETVGLVVVDIAKRPTPEVMTAALSKLEKHDTYFGMIGTGLVLAWGLLLWIAGKVWM